MNNFCDFFLEVIVSNIWWDVHVRFFLKAELVWSIRLTLNCYTVLIWGPEDYQWSTWGTTSNLEGLLPMWLANLNMDLAINKIVLNFEVTGGNSYCFTRVTLSQSHIPNDTEFACLPFGVCKEAVQQSNPGRGLVALEQSRNERDEWPISINVIARSMAPCLMPLTSTYNRDTSHE